MSSPHEPNEHSESTDETRPLLPKITAEPLIAGSLSYKTELVALARLAIPIWLTNCMEYSQGAWSVLVLGRLGTRELAAMGVAQLLQNCAVHSLAVIGPACALDTLCNAAYTSNSPHLTGLYAQRTAVISFALLLPCILALSFAEPFLLLIRQDPELAHMSAKIMRILIWQAPFLSIFEICRKWLMAQGLVRVPTLLAVFTAPLSCFLIWLLVLGPIDSLRVGVYGAPVTLTLVQAVAAFLILLYCTFFVKDRKAWNGWTSDAFRDLRPVIALAAAGAATVASEAWSWDGIALASSYLGAVAYSSNIIANYTVFVSYWLPLAVMSACSIRVGNCLGANRSLAARHAAKTAYVTATAIGILTAMLLSFSGRKIVMLFTKDKDIIQVYVTELLPLIALAIAFDDVTAACYGILRGVGKADIAAKANIVSYWCLGIPTGVYLAFTTTMGVRGFWVGNAVSLITIASITTWSVISIDWEEAALRVIRQTQETEAALAEYHQSLQEEDAEA